MEKFVAKINCVRKTDDGKFFLVLDIFLNDTKVGQAEADFSVFQGIMISKFQECAYTSHMEKMLNLSQSITTPQN